MHLFRHLAQKLLDIHEYACVVSVQFDEKADCASDALSLCGVAVYLSPMIDCFDGMPVSWEIGTSPDANMVNSMLDSAVLSLKENEHPIVHSDRGSHYRWQGWIDRMDKYHLTRSMSKKGCSPDNSACEGFFGLIKNAIFYGRDWKGVSIDEFITFLNNYLHWFREKRIKQKLGYKSPIQYRASIGVPFIPNRALNC